MKPTVIVVTGLAAILGAFIWGGITYFTETEFGLVAWGIGGLVGAAAAVASKGGDDITGFLAGGLTLGSILLGKLLAVQFMVPGYAEEVFAEGLTQQAYATLVTEAEAFAGVDEENWKEFMVEHGYTEAESWEAVTAEELEYFESDAVPMLRDMATDSRPNYEDWRAKQKEMFTAALNQAISPIDILKESLGLFDIIFIVLGVGTAFRLGKGTGGAPAAD